MTAPLWTLSHLVAATRADLDGSPPSAVTGVSIDTRSLAPGDLFVALKDVRDGHEFVTTAFAKGAAAALVGRDYVRKPGDGAVLRVGDPLSALEDLGRAARTRLAREARVIAVTGSVGKTTTKEMLRACLSPLGDTHAADKSFNNHWGVPLTLARMPGSTRYGVFEIGMNHAGEITPLTRMVRPHVAIVTAVEAVHLEHFASVAGIAEAKAEIFCGLMPGGAAVVPRDNPHYELLAARAAQQGARIVTFGSHADAHMRLTHMAHGPKGTTVTAHHNGRVLRYMLAAPGAHIASISLAIAAALDLVGLDPGSALDPLTAMGAPQGRGSRVELSVNGGDAILIDESYNANPASMRAALAAMDTIPRSAFPRRIAVLGDMLELGPDAPALHAGLVAAIEAAGVDLVLLCGPDMRHLYDALPDAKRVTWAETSAGIERALLALVDGGDVVMIKGSNGSRMAPLVSALIRHTGVKWDS